MRENSPPSARKLTAVHEVTGGFDRLTDHPDQDQAGLAHQALIGQLRDGSLRSGMFLSMPMLVTKLGFSLAAVREAVKRAETSSLVQILPKRGVIVMHSDAETTRECMELRAIFDNHGARRLLLRGHELPLAALRGAHENVRDAASGNIDAEMQRRAIETDISLHDALATGLEGVISRRLYTENRDRIAVIQNQRPFLPDRIIPAMTEHLAIISAFETKDIDGLDHAIWDHLINTLRWWGIDASDLTGPAEQKSPQKQLKKAVGVGVSGTATRQDA